jgi:hypothetical protein
MNKNLILAAFRRSRKLQNKLTVGKALFPPKVVWVTKMGLPMVMPLGLRVAIFLVLGRLAPLSYHGGK